MPENGEERECRRLIANIRNGDFKSYFEHTDEGGEPSYILGSEEKPGYWLKCTRTKKELVDYCKSIDIKVGKIYCIIPNCSKHRRR